MGKSKVHYEQAHPNGTRQSANHLANKVQCPKYRKRGRGAVKPQALA